MKPNITLVPIEYEDLILLDITFVYGMHPEGEIEVFKYIEGEWTYWATANEEYESGMDFKNHLDFRKIQLYVPQ